MKGRIKGRIEYRKSSIPMSNSSGNALVFSKFQRANKRAYRAGQAIEFIPTYEGCGDTVILNGTQDGTQGGTQGGTQDLADFGKWLEEQIKENPKVTTTELALKSGKGIRTIKRYISKLPHIRYVGSDYSGHWEIREQ